MDSILSDSDRIRLQLHIPRTGVLLGLGDPEQSGQRVERDVHILPCGVFCLPPCNKCWCVFAVVTNSAHNRNNAPKVAGKGIHKVAHKSPKVTPQRPPTHPKVEYPLARLEALVGTSWGFTGITHD